jgi:hypothetical protein
MIITKWFRQVKNDAGEKFWDFNHIDDGYNPELSHPRPKTEEHKSWKNSTWLSEKAQLIDGKVVK